MKHYTPKQINDIKQEIRTGKPVSIIADELAKEWKRPVAGVYSKVLRLSKQTRKINNNYIGPNRKPRVKKAPRPSILMKFDPLPGSLFNDVDNRIEEIVAEVKANNAETVLQEICEEIVEKPIERQPAEIGIELPVGVMSFVGTPSRIVVYQDHVRYYFDN